jgi:hypothetical protein
MYVLCTFTLFLLSFFLFYFFDVEMVSVLGGRKRFLQWQLRVLLTWQGLLISCSWLPNRDCGVIFT